MESIPTDTRALSIAGAPPPEGARRVQVAPQLTTEPGEPTPTPPAPPAEPPDPRAPDPLPPTTDGRLPWWRRWVAMLAGA